VAAIVLVSRRGTNTAPVGSSDPVAPSASASAGGHADRVVVSVTADLPIESVRCTGVKVVELDGTRARLEVAPWWAARGVPALRRGGAVAPGTLDEGARDVHLKVDAAPPPASASASAKVGRPAATARPAASTDLRKNPYGP